MSDVQALSCARTRRVQRRGACGARGTLEGIAKYILRPPLAPDPLTRGRRRPRLLGTELTYRSVDAEGGGLDELAWCGYFTEKTKTRTLEPLVHSGGSGTDAPSAR